MVITVYHSTNICRTGKTLFTRVNWHHVYMKLWLFKLNTLVEQSLIWAMNQTFIMNDSGFTRAQRQYELLIPWYSQIYHSIDYHIRTSSWYWHVITVVFCFWRVKELGVSGRTGSGESLWFKHPHLTLRFPVNCGSENSATEAQNARLSAGIKLPRWHFR